jgi:transposase
MKLYVGDDLHSSNNYLAIIDEKGKRVFHRKLPNDRATIINTLAPYEGTIAGIVVESTYNWYWLVDMLMDEGYKLHLANPSAIKKYEGLKHVNDNDDAFWLAEMLRLHILPEGYIYPKEDRPIRDLLRKRRHLVSLRTSLIISLQNIISRNCGHGFNANDVKKIKEDMISPILAYDEDLALAFSEAAELARRYDERIRVYYNRKMQKTNFMVAHNAIAHKLARAAYYIMRDNVPFVPEKLFT